MSVDLHTHTTASDGALAPEELARRAAARGLEVLAITDHDAIAGYDAALRGAAPGLAIIAGAELTCHIDGREAHILAYAFDPADRAFRAALAGFAELRAERAREIVRRLNGLGVEIRYEDVTAAAAGGTIARPHVARVLVERGVVGSLDEAFARFLGRNAPAFVEKRALAPEKAFRLVREAGGVSSLAHPGTFRRDDLIPALVRAGLDGLEVLHTEHTRAQRERYAALAAELRLLPTGGSDFHGTPGHRSRLGVPDVPVAWASALVARGVERR